MWLHILWVLEMTDEVVYNGYCDWQGRQHIYVIYEDQDKTGFTKRCLVCKSNVRCNYPLEEEQ